MQRLQARAIEVWDHANTRRLATVSFHNDYVPSLQEVLHQADPQQADQPLRLRLDNAVLPNEAYWQQQVRQRQDAVLRLTLRAPPSGERRTARADIDTDLPAGECFAVCGPRGDTVYPDKEAFLERVRAMIREDGWQELRLVFPNEDADDVCREFQEQGVEILRAQGVMKLQKSWHKKAAWAGGVVGGFWILSSGRKGLSAFLAGRQALADFGRLRSIAALGGASLAAGAATLAVQWGLERTLPRLFEQEYTVVMKKSGEGMQEVIRVKGGSASRELLLGQEVEAMLEDFVGQPALKQQIRDFGLLMYQESQRKSQPNRMTPNHMLLEGSPGTGKTTVAQMLGQILYHLGVIRSNKVVTVQRGDLVGQYVGWTAARTRQVVNSAKGGILFVDEAYRLSSQGGVDFGREAIEEIMKDMESGDPLAIFAGYPADMNQFLQTNAGLSRRIRHTFQLADYTVLELSEIFRRKVQQSDFTLQDVTAEDVANLIGEFTTSHWRSTHNAGGMDRMFERCKEKQAQRLYRQRGQVDPYVLTLEDVDAAVRQLQ